MDLIELMHKMERPALHGHLLVFDPGHTTGWAVFHDSQLVECGETDTTTIEIATPHLTELITAFEPWHIVLEDYRIYRWRAKHHAGSDLPTARVIGCIETLALQQGLAAPTKQPAQIAKGFCTDKKLKEWGYYQPGKKHASDAIRHGCYFLLFGAIRPQDKRSKVG